MLNINLVRKATSLILGSAVLALTTTISLANPGYHNTPGAACGAYNNNQANRLIRDHVRMYLPTSAPSRIFVVCPVTRNVEDLASSLNDPQLFINVYFGIGVPTGTAVTCIVRNWGFDNTHFPGVQMSGAPLNGYLTTATKLGTTGTAETRDAFVNLTGFDNDVFAYVTVTCPLAPGTGINSIDFNQI